MEEFLKLLNDWDFYYQYSDDIRVYRDGKSQGDKIDALRKSNPQYEAAFQKWMSVEHP